MFSQRLRYYATLFWLIVIAPLTLAEAVSEQELKAAMLFKFAQFTDWPTSPVGEFRLCVFGKDRFEGAANRLEGKTLQGAKVTVKFTTSIDDAKSCQVLFLSPDKPKQCSQWVSALKGLPIIIASDAAEAWDEGVMIVFAVEPNRITFKINASAARQAGLTFRAQMLQVAREVR